MRTYVLSLAGVLALGFLPAVSLLISTVLAALTTWVGAAFPESAIEHAVNFAVSLATISILFAMLFKWFPDTDVAWRDVWFGAIVAALLFNLGKGLIAWYFGTQALESTYGAAACIVVLLIRDYYAAQIVLFGAELTHAYAACAARAGPWEPTRPQPTVPTRLP